MIHLLKAEGDLKNLKKKRKKYRRSIIIILNFNPFKLSWTQIMRFI